MASDSNATAAAAMVHTGEIHANTNFVLTGWADNYTGTEAINARLRAKRAEGVRPGGLR